VLTTREKEAASGEEAIALLRTESPRLVVMDIILPGMNGIEATRQIKATLPSAQIVMLTVHEDDTYRTDATVAGASAYVPKRAMQTELSLTLAALLANDHPGIHGGQAPKALAHAAMAEAIKDILWPQT
jgi:DNA-binding NarL/FixJ family response regulator